MQSKAAGLSCTAPENCTSRPSCNEDRASPSKHHLLMQLELGLQKEGWPVHMCDARPAYNSSTVSLKECRVKGEGGARRGGGDGGRGWVWGSGQAGRRPETKPRSYKRPWSLAAML